MKLHRALCFGAASLAISAGGVAAQVNSPFVISGEAAEQLYDRISINADTARRIAEACEAIAVRNNSRVVVVILNPYGLTIHQHAMDGEGYVSINAAQQKAMTALRTRRPSVILTNRNNEDRFTQTHMYGYGLTVQEGGLPIIVDGQLIGAIGVGGIPAAHRNATYDEDKCAYDAVVSVVGPQPELPRNLEAEEWEGRPGPLPQ
jgi:glc operon protein GlcG